MVIGSSARKLAKKIIPAVVLKNLTGLSSAVNSYYPEYLFGNGRINKLRSVSIEVTFRCNCRCQMCPLYGIHTGGGEALVRSMKEKEELTVEEFRGLFKGLRDLGTRSVHFTGGEAFLRKDMLDITCLAREAGLEVSFTSNGGLLTREIAKRVVELGVNSIIISLDGPKEIHEDIRKARVFGRIMEAVDWINEEKRRQNRQKPEINFLCTVSALNQNHLGDLVEIAKGKNVPLTIDPIIFTSDDIVKDSKEILQGGFAKQESFLMPDEIGKVDIDLLEKELEAVSDNANKLDHQVYVSLARKKTRRKFFSDPAYSVVNKCFAPWYSCRIDPYGNVYPCSLSVNMGNIREHAIGDIINGDQFVSFRNKLKNKKLLPFCSKCCILYSHHKFWNFLPAI
ncbi:MAG: radical SAM protein [Nitrospiraceae bacterium]|nr:MAG: radical SAM protein [Nitrospiraceae bacterium]